MPVPPAGISSVSAPDHCSLDTAGKMRHGPEVVFLICTDCVVGWRTCDLKTSAVGSADALTHMPVSVSASGGCPST